MGLDMYLNATKYLFRQDEGGKDVAEIFPEIKDLPVKSILVEAAYWRKANHIHNWFVRNVQGNEDDCDSYSVSRETLEELLLLCEQVAKHPEKADELLPTAPGFFFGSIEYDEWYVEGINETITQIKRCLELPPEWDFEYRSSW